MPDPTLVLAVCLGLIMASGAFWGVHFGWFGSLPIRPAEDKTGAVLVQSTAGAPRNSTPTPTRNAPSASPTTHALISEIFTATPVPDPSQWPHWPVIPEMTTRAREIYQAGLQMGNHPGAFSKIGACESSATWFLDDYDRGPAWYNLGEYGALQAAIDYFSGSFNRTSLAARDGARVSTLLSSMWSDPVHCQVDETPLDCEYRVHKPAFALISIGTNDIEDSKKFEEGLRQIVDITIQHGVVPVLATKADNREGDHQNNVIIIKLAIEYQLPVWNFWAAVQELPSAGLEPDQSHLTWGDNFFDRPGALQTGWAMRNLTGLQALDALMNSQSQSSLRDALEDTP